MNKDLENPVFELYLQQSLQATVLRVVINRLNSRHPDLAEKVEGYLRYIAQPQ